MPPKVSLYEMILTQNREVERLEAWQRVFGTEGTCPSAYHQRALQVARRTMETLQLLEQFQDQFVAMVAEARERARAEAIAAAEAKAAREQEAAERSSRVPR